ncbi:uncharacterized protein LOC135199295 isoform X2 [Macrobrachium nipponense]|uniref:uncharacterized protein LOC135199295 isoform X2 n=1 Tax=Macrobrachium nipponense TaxID=159736 RepID=UPI0030C88581
MVHLVWVMSALNGPVIPLLGCTGAHVVNNYPNLDQTDRLSESQERTITMDKEDFFFRGISSDIHTTHVVNNYPNLDQTDRLSKSQKRIITMDKEEFFSKASLLIYVLTENVKRLK